MSSSRRLLTVIDPFYRTGVNSQVSLLELNLVPEDPEGPNGGSGSQDEQKSWLRTGFLMIKKGRGREKRRICRRERPQRHVLPLVPGGSRFLLFLTPTLMHAAESSLALTD